MKSYSIVIRTLGTGTSKYRALLDSILNQTIKPLEVFVILPTGYPEPSEKLGFERFIYTSKGMLHQRIFGLEFCAKYSSAKYILALDDDVEFESDYAEKAMDIMNQTTCDILAPTVLDEINPYIKVESPWSFKNLITRIKGLRTISNNSPFRIKIMRTGGVEVNTILNGVIPTQSFHGSGVWLKNNCINDLDIKSEYWVERCRYALPEDQVIGYKAYLMGKIELYTTEVKHFHLDAGVSTGEERKFHRAFAFGRNFLIFWHRFILMPTNSKYERLLARIAIFRRYVFQILGTLVSGTIQNDFSSFKGLISGINDGYKYLKSNDYITLPKIKIENKAR